MEAGTLSEQRLLTAGERVRELARRYPGGVAIAVLALVALALVIGYGLHDTAQRSLNGLSLEIGRAHV